MIWEWEYSWSGNEAIDGLELRLRENQSLWE